MFPKPGDKLTMHYRYVYNYLIRHSLNGFQKKALNYAVNVDLFVGSGTLSANGKKFDSSYDRGRPFQFTIGIGQVIRGWDEGVMTMSIGEKAVLHITSDYGYGSRGAGGVIPPNAALDFEVELLEINGMNKVSDLL